jgi:tRNA (cytidine/uridine-2'-O-)-methyltransferase
MKQIKIKGVFSIALYQPDIPQNTGTIMRLASCFGLDLHIIEPSGFRSDNVSLKRSGMDYIEELQFKRHISWKEFLTWSKDNTKNLVLATTKTDHSYLEYSFDANDILIMGRESEGVPDNVHHICQKRITIPMKKGLRSLNVAIASAIITSEALRQINILR